ncbi:MAG: DUF445 family protein, partial [Spirochaetales bacterium]|nr:DUF445 family protein [Spirochaetales bacterium]
IGLFTNWLAIKMLFRPLLERRIFGIRVPFTPGILPRERARIAQSMGDTVASDLLNDETLSARLRSDSFKKAIALAVLDIGKRALRATPDDIVGGIDGHVQAVIRAAVLKAVAGLSSSDSFSNAFIAGTDSALAASNDISLEEMLGEKTLSSAAGLVTAAMASDRFASSFAGAVTAALQHAAGSGKALTSFVDADTIRTLAAQAIDSAYPSFIKAASDLFEDRAIKLSMERIGAKIIRRTLDRFNSVQRFFISLGQYDSAILDNMPDTIADFYESTITILREDATKQAIVSRLAEYVVTFAQKPFASFDFIADPVKRDSATERLSSILSHAFSSLDEASMELAIRNALARSTVGEVLNALPGLADRLGPALAVWISEMFGQGLGVETPGSAIATAFFRAFSDEFSQTANAMPLGRTIAVNESDIVDIADAASEAISELAASESAGLLRSLDLRQLVVDKIDGLHIIDVEKMILRVVDRELGAITIFGGILGAIIGLSQSIILLFR